MEDRGRKVVEELLATIDYLQITVDAGEGLQWLPCDDLVAHPPRLLEVGRSTAAGWSLHRPTTGVALPPLPA